MGTYNRDIRLVKRPEGLPQPGDFELVESPLPTPAPGQVLVKNLYMSVDPYMRGRMAERRSYAPPFQLGEVLQGSAVGRVVVGGGGFKPGDYVVSPNGWRAWFVSDGRDLTRVDPAIAPLRAYLGVLGMTGLTAYAGLTRVGGLKPGDRVFVSAAAGAVGSIACQIARALGCEIVVGSAGSEEKCAWLRREVGLRAAINYRVEDDLTAAIAREMPGGIDLYFENAGGRHLAAALDNMREQGRIVICGMIDQYNAAEPPPGPRNLELVLTRRLTLRGFLVLDHLDLRERFLSDMRDWIKEGKMTWRETVVEGLEQAPSALIGLFQGANIGKMLVKIAEDD
jgi:NADPH-dependent curcumin reductase CurA